MHADKLNDLALLKMSGLSRTRVKAGEVEFPCDKEDHSADGQESTVTLGAHACWKFHKNDQILHNEQPITHSEFKRGNNS